MNYTKHAHCAQLIFKTGIHTIDALNVKKKIKDTLLSVKVVIGNKKYLNLLVQKITLFNFQMLKIYQKEDQELIIFLYVMSVEN